MENKERPHKIQEIMKSAMQELKTMIDVNTVIGKPIFIEDGVSIIPITKVIVGLVAGGGEYTENTLSKQKIEEYPFAAGSGSGFQIIPIGFLLKENGNYKLIELEEKSNVTSLTDIIKKVMDNFSKDKMEEEDETKL